VTADDLPSAHYEHTVLVTKDGYTILTKRWWYAKEKTNQKNSCNRGKET
jgi:hypothetical protein